MRGPYPALGIFRLLHHLPNFLRLFWRLFRDPRVPAYKKILPVISGIICAAYILFPIDILPDFVAFIGQLDDTTVVLVIMGPTIWRFVRSCPKDIVKEHAHQINSGAS